MRNGQYFDISSEVKRVEVKLWYENNGEVKDSKKVKVKSS